MQCCDDPRSTPTNPLTVVLAVRAPRWWAYRTHFRRGIRSRRSRRVRNDVKIPRAARTRPAQPAVLAVQIDHCRLPAPDGVGDPHDRHRASKAALRPTELTGVFAHLARAAIRVGGGYLRRCSRRNVVLGIGDLANQPDRRLRESPNRARSSVYKSLAHHACVDPSGVHLCRQPRCRLVAGSNVPARAVDSTSVGSMRTFPLLHAGP